MTRSRTFLSLVIALVAACDTDSDDEAPVAYATSTGEPAAACEATECGACIELPGCHWSADGCAEACVQDAACYGPDAGATCPEPDCIGLADCKICLAHAGCNWTNGQCSGVCLEAATCVGPDSVTSGTCSAPDGTDDGGTCSNGSLSFGPVTLPGAVVGVEYDLALRDHADPQWSGVEYMLENPLPEGLEFTEDPPHVSGIPKTAGDFTFTVAAVHGISDDGCSTAPDPHAFRLVVAAE